MTDATPRPWAVSYSGDIIPAEHLDRKIGGSADRQRDRDYYAHIILRAPDDPHGRGDAAAHVALAVRAVNVHDGLVEALELWQASDDEINEGAKQVARQIAREKRDTALAAARESAP